MDSMDSSSAEGSPRLKVDEDAIPPDETPEPVTDATSGHDSGIVLGAPSEGEPNVSNSKSKHRETATSEPSSPRSTKSNKPSALDATSGSLKSIGSPLGSPITPDQQRFSMERSASASKSTASRKRSIIDPGSPQTVVSERRQLALLRKQALSDRNSPDVTRERASTPSSTSSASKEGRNVNRRDGKGETPLYVACKKGDIAAVKKLLDDGADINAADNAGWTPLHEAANRGREDVVKILLKHKADLNARSMDGTTPLMDAVINSHVEIVKILVQAGADTSVSDSKGQTCQSLAVGNDAILSILNPNHHSITASMEGSKPEPTSTSSGVEPDAFGGDRPRIHPSAKAAIEGLHKPIENIAASFSSIVTSVASIPPVVSLPSFYSKESPLHFSFPPIAPTSRPPQSQYEDISDDEEELTTNPLVVPTTGAPVIVTSAFNAYSTSLPTSMSVSSVNTMPNQFVSHSHTFQTPPSLSPEAILKKTLASMVAPVNTPLTSNAATGIPQLNVPLIVVDQHRDSNVVKGNDSAGDVGKSRPKLKPATEEPPKPQLTSEEKKEEDRISDSLKALGLVPAIPDERKSPKPPSQSATSSQSSTLSTPKESIRAPSPKVTETPKEVVAQPPVHSASTMPIPPPSKEPTVQSPTKATSVAFVPPPAPALFVPFVPPPAPVRREEKRANKRPSTSAAPRSAAPPPVSSPRARTPTKTTRSRLSSPVRQEDPINARIIKKEELEPASVSRKENKNENVNSADESGRSPRKKKEVSTRPMTRQRAQKDGSPAAGSKRKHSKEDEKAVRTTRGKRATAEANEPVSGDKEEQEAEEARQKRLRGQGAKKPRADKEEAKITPQKSVEPPSVQEPTSRIESSLRLPFKKRLTIRNEIEEFVNQRRTVEENWRRYTNNFPLKVLPKNLNDYLIMKKTYNLEASIPKRLDIPPGVPTEMRTFFVEQENERHELMRQQTIERDRLIMTAEQEMLRLHQRYCRLSAGISVPYSACMIISEQQSNRSFMTQEEEERSPTRCRASMRELIKWLEETDRKYDIAKKEMLTRHRLETAMLRSKQHMDWAWKMTDLHLLDPNNRNPEDQDNVFIPQVMVEDFVVIPDSLSAGIR